MEETRRDFLDCPAFSKSGHAALVDAGLTNGQELAKHVFGRFLGSAARMGTTWFDGT
jgi:hypothetical protein